QVHVRNPQIGGPGYARFAPAYGEPVGLRSDENLAVIQRAYRLVATPMTERKLFGFAAECERKQLVPEADSEHRCTGISQFPHVLRSVGHRRRIPWPVRQEHTIRLERENLVCRGVGGHYGNAAIVVFEDTQNVAL